MCGKHSPPAFRDGGNLVGEASGSSGEKARPASREFAGLELGGTREAVYHCEEHAHTVAGPLTGLIVFGVALAVLGVVVLFFAVLPGLVLLLLGAGTAGIAFAVDRRRAQEACANPPPLPLVPLVNTVEVVEWLSGNVRLENGDYTSEAEAVAGEIKIDMSAGDGRKRLELYRKKYNLPEDRPVKFTAGYAILSGEAGLEFLEGQQAVLENGLGASLGGDSADGHGLFPAAPGRTQGDWTLRVDYRLQKDRVTKDIPLWIVPSLVPASDRRTLEIDLHWNRLGSARRRLDLQLFDRIDLEVPASWGNVESISPGRVETSKSGGRRVIKWQRLKPGDEDSRKLAKGSRSRTLAIRFERPITEEAEPSGNGASQSGLSGTRDDKKKLTLSGTLEATFGGTLSGVTSVGLYLPGGGRGHQAEIKPQTKVRVDFDISLCTLRYQDDRVIPDENNADDRELGRNKADEFQRVVPDYRTVAELTNAISGDSYYVKSVVEHPPYRDDGRPNVVNHVWDIAGRRYEGVFPIDFDINLRGHEIGQGVASVFSGKSVAQVTVKGAHAKGITAGDMDDSLAGAVGATNEDDDDELLRRIEDTWTGLHGKVVQILAARAAAANGIRAIAAAEDVVPGEAVEPDGYSAQDAVIVDAEIVDSGPRHERLGNGEGAYRMTDLRKQRKAADDAVIAGRISEEIYRGIIARIAAEQAELGESS
jgi:hypothetical protein